MKKFIFITVFILQSGLSYSTQGWIEYPEITSNVLRSIYFINSNTGFVCGNNGALYKTTDGAVNWFPLSIPSNRDFQNIYFIDDQRGLLTTVPEGSEAGYWFIVYMTTDQGASWFQLIQFGNFISDFYNDGNEFFLSFEGVFGFETVGGISYSQVNVINFNSIPYIEYFRNSRVFSVCKSNDKIWISASYGDDVGTDVNRLGFTSNSGSSWNIVYNDSAVLWNADPSHNRFYKIRFLNDSIGYLASMLGLMKTVNGGYDWSFIDTTFTKNIRHHFFTTADTGWVFKQNNIFKTTDGGNNFDLQFSYSSNFTQPFFLNSLTGYILCANGRILKTITGGLTGIYSNTNISLPEIFSLSQNYPNPFNPSTLIRYSIPSDDRNQTSDVKLIVYNNLGKEIMTLVNEKQNAGSYTVDFNGEGLPSGVYFYRLEAGELSETKRMILLK